MSKAPTPWVAMIHPDFDAEWSIMQGTFFVATVHDCVDGESAEDVAKKIAAVPVMLAALEEIATKRADTCPGDGMEDAYAHLRSIARAAIAKAQQP